MTVLHTPRAITVIWIGAFAAMPERSLWIGSSSPATMDWLPSGNQSPAPCCAPLPSTLWRRVTHRWITRVLDQPHFRVMPSQSRNHKCRIVFDVLWHQPLQMLLGQCANIRFDRGPERVVGNVSKHRWFFIFRRRIFAIGFELYAMLECTR
jgi:hypothetical protein